MCKIMLATGTMVGGAYAIELFIAWYSGNFWEWFTFKNRILGPYAWAYFDHGELQPAGPAVLLEQAGARRTCGRPWSRSACLINVGMWFERFVIIVSSLARQRPARHAGVTSRPPSWDIADPDRAASVCSSPSSFCSSASLPIVAIAEVKAVSPAAHAGKDH
jgi:hypothetical protein